MILTEINADLFNIHCDAYVQCISADFAMGAGIARQFNEHFDVRSRAISLYGNFVDRWISLSEHGTCIYIDLVYCLITKCNYWQKPTYQTMRMALESFKWVVVNHPYYSSSFKVGMPKIGCGLDHLQWELVKCLLYEVLSPIDCQLIVCTL